MSRIAVVLIAMIALLLTGVLALKINERQQQLILPELQGLGGDFSLPSTEGHDIALEDFRGKLVLLNFGFSTCPDVCPTVLARMKSVMDGLGASENQVQPLFITIDPDRDTIGKLKNYLSFFHPSLIGLRGDSKQLQAVASLYKAHYEKQELESALEYSFLHNDHIYLIDGSGKVRAMYSNSVLPETIVIELESLL